MSIYDELMKKPIEELREELLSNIDAAKESNMYAQFGSLGVSPSHMKMYAESMSIINDYKSKRGLE